ncbi:hypothetical protein Pcinc_013832 [Petrolisthes cinctipes]|uniref:Uncharacterized protein n=1 Tax=Petrolisthes cinctipes TaxID=88211 RepID=A0AAE1FXS3_PETCI|nr:hypothetical protein Pcinc_013832 [Petrolisthes cinctipes]
MRVRMSGVDEGQNESEWWMSGWWMRVRMSEKSAKHRGCRAEENRGASFCKICSVFLTHHKKIQPILKLLLLEELNNMNFIVPIAASSLRIPPSKPSC